MQKWSGFRFPESDGDSFIHLWRNSDGAAPNLRLSDGLFVLAVAKAEITASRSWPKAEHIELGLTCVGAGGGIISSRHIASVKADDITRLRQDPRMTAEKQTYPVFSN